MNKDEMLKLAKKHRAVFALEEWRLEEPDFLAFANTCEKIGMEKAAKICDNQIQEYHCDGEPRRMEYVCAEEIRKAT